VDATEGATLVVVEVDAEKDEEREMVERREVSDKAWDRGAGRAVIEGRDLEGGLGRRPISEASGMSSSSSSPPLDLPSTAIDLSPPPTEDKASEGAAGASTTPASESMLPTSASEPAKPPSDVPHFRLLRLMTALSRRSSTTGLELLLLVWPF
jgi:hypothetical protein